VVSRWSSKQQDFPMKQIVVNGVYIIIVLLILMSRVKEKLQLLTTDSS